VLRMGDPLGAPLKVTMFALNNPATITMAAHTRTCRFVLI